MALTKLSLSDIYLGWLLLFTLVFGTIGFFKAQNNLRSIVEYVALATAVAAFAAALFAVPMWGVIKLASH